ncbi:hypothetical protein FB107DRAFT_273904 [Schizophyllum commune]
MMRLYMTRRSSLHTVYSDPEGHTLYKVRTPFTLAKGRRWDISRAKEHPSPYPAQREYDPLAQIHWRRDLTTLSIGEQSINAANFFRRTGLYGRSLSFTGPDGYEYKWVLGTLHPQLVRVDEKQTLIAKYYKERHKVPFIKHRPAYLDIFPPGEAMADIIFITFLYIHKVRHDRLNVLRSLQDDGLE